MVNTVAMHGQRVRDLYRETDVADRWSLTELNTDTCSTAMWESLKQIRVLASDAEIAVEL